MTVQEAVQCEVEDLYVHKSRIAHIVSICVNKGTVLY